MKRTADNDHQTFLRAEQFLAEFFQAFHIWTGIDCSSMGECYSYYFNLQITAAILKQL